MQGLHSRTAELQLQIANMTEHYEVLEALYFEVRMPAGMIRSSSGS